MPIPAAARDLSISVPATSLDKALTALAHETNAEIISTEAGLRAIRTPALHGTMSVRTALRRLLADTGYRAVRVSGGGYRIVRAPPPMARRIRPVPIVPPADPADIVVTASKQRVPLLRYPGSLTSITGTSTLSANEVGDMADVAVITPVLQSTQLGAGRNKIFIRGIADSSFNGASQSTASIYLDDVQLNYSGPDPGLRLYDIRSVDVMEGPQGTLYGAGAIGGVIRLTSNPVDLAAVHASMAGGVTATDGGEAGFDVAGMVNMPLKTDLIGVRAVGYRIRDGGYIDDRGRGLSNINRTDTLGGRLALRVDVGDGWRVDLSGAGQQIDSRDGQYAERSAGPFARRSLLAQPFHSRLLFGRLVLTKDWDTGLRLVSASGIATLDTSEMFDASVGVPPYSIPASYDLDNSKLLLTQETRLSRSLSNGGSWVAGFALLSNRDILSRTLGSPGNEATIIGVTNVTRAASAFAEATIPLRPNLSVTLGARATEARIDGEPSSRPRSNAFVKGRSTQRIDPTIAMSWLVLPHVAAFARFQTGYRTGGLAVARGVGRVADYGADSIMVGEIGVRRLRAGETGLTFSGSISAARWSDAQADLINRRGQPYTVNLGDAQIYTAEGMVDWTPLPGLNATGTFLYTRNTVDDVTGAQPTAINRLPETPPVAARAGLSYEWPVRDLTFRSVGTLGYVGWSTLGMGDLLDVRQGNYVTLDLSGSVKWRNIEVSLAIANATNRSANRFAFGNPFTLWTGDQTTPLRPLNARLGVAVNW
jgi:outer membrane receptor protein involved in Fe transport